MGWPTELAGRIHEEWDVGMIAAVRVAHAEGTTCNNQAATGRTRSV
jgi:hypothetical protein